MSGEILRGASDALLLELYETIKLDVTSERLSPDWQARLRCSASGGSGSSSMLI